MCLAVSVGWIPFAPVSSLLADPRTVTLPIGRMQQAKLIGWNGSESNETGLAYRWGGSAPQAPFRMPWFTASAYRVQLHATALNAQPIEVQLDGVPIASLAVTPGVFRHYEFLATPYRWGASPFHNVSFHPASPSRINDVPHSIAVASLSFAPVRGLQQRATVPDPTNPVSRDAQLLWLICAIALGSAVALRVDLGAGFAAAVVYSALCALLWDPLLIAVVFVTATALVLGALRWDRLCALAQPFIARIAVFQRHWPLVLWLVFVLLASVRLAADRGGDTCAVINVACIPLSATNLQGDEPRYVAIATTLVTQFTARQPLSPETFKNGYSMHSIGVPLLIGPAVVFGGVWAARLVVIVLVGSLVYIVTQWLTELTQRPGVAAALALGLCVALPFVPASAALYPDALAGVAFLWCIYAAGTTTRSRWLLILSVVALALLPWLHAKYLTLQLFVLVLSALGWYLDPPAGSKRLWLMLAIGFVVAEVLLLRYHLVAWGNILGPLNGHSVVLSWEQSRYILGLLIDQNQGVFAQHPLLLIGVYGLGPLYRASKRLAALTVVCAGAPLLVNGLHWNIYGGYSYSGRFASVSAVVLLVPALYGLAALNAHAPVLVRRLLGASAALQLYLLWVVTIVVSMNQRPVTVLNIPVTKYSLWYGAFGEAMGLFVAGSNPWRHAGNYFWVALLVALFGYGIARARSSDTVTADPDASDAPLPQ